MALVGGPLILLMVILDVLVQPQTLRAAAEGYWNSVAETANSTIWLVCPLAAAVAAWDIATLRVAGVLRHPSTRPATAIMGRSLVSALVSGLLGLALSWVLVLPRAVGGPTGVDLVILAVAPLIVAASVLVGGALSLVLPARLAPPVVLIGTWCWFAMPQSFQPFWLRHLNGYEGGCCDAGSQVTLPAALAPGLVAVGLGAWAVTLAASRIALWHRAPTVVAVGALVTGVLCAGVGLGVAVAMVQDYGNYPVVARTGATVCSTDSEVRVCVWPEHAQNLPAMQEAVLTARSRLAAVGYRVPDTASESSRDGTPWRIVASAEATEDRDLALNSAVSGLANTWVGEGLLQDCDSPEVQDAWPDHFAAVDWLATAVGLPTEPTGEDPTVSAAARALAGLPTDQQATWVATAITRMQAACSASATVSGAP